MKLSEAVNLVDRELKRVGIISERRFVTDWWATWVCNQFDIYLNFYKGAFWNEDAGSRFYNGLGVTIEQSDIRESGGTKVAFYSDINDLNLNEWLDR